MSHSHGEHITDVYIHDEHPHSRVSLPFPADSAPRLHLRGTVLPDGEIRDLWLVDGMISDEPVNGAHTVADGVWIVPGLVDAHCHVGIPYGDFTGPISHKEAEAQAIADRDRGTLLMRDAGSPTNTRWIDDRVDLPKIIRAGRHIAAPKRYIRGLPVEVEPESLAEEVERQVANADGWVKLVGDWIDRDEGDLRPLWPASEAKAGIERAHALGAKVTAHCFAEQSVAELVDAGIDGIEHGTGITDNVIEKMAQHKVALVPTMINLENFPKFAAAGEAKFPMYAKHMRDLHRRRKQTLRKAHEAGVPIYAGTDAGGSVHHGHLPEEILLLSQIGGNEFALQAASWGAREWLGAPNLVEGASADLVVYAEDPRVHLGIVCDPLLVILRGHVVKQ